MKTVQVFKAARRTRRWNLNQRVWVRYAYANHLEKKAAGCDAKNPELATAYRRRIEAIRVASEASA